MKNLFTNCSQLRKRAITLGLCALWGSNLCGQTQSEPYITVTTDRYLKNWSIQANSDGTTGVQQTIWADFNNNGTRDNGEGFIYGQDNKSAVDASNKTLKIYGKVAELQLMLNRVKEIDLSHNPHLQYANLSDNMLSSVNFSNNPELFGVDVCNNPMLTSIDVTQLPKLTKLVAYKTGIGSFDLTHNPNLTSLQCKRTKITSLDLSKNPKLFWLDCAENRLTTLDVTQNPELTDLIAPLCDLGTVDLSRNKKLKNVSLHSCKLTELNLSANENLGQLFIYSNQIDMMAMSQLVRTLADRSGTTAGKLYVMDTKAGTSHPENNKFIDSFAAICKQKNWTVYDYRGAENKGDNPYDGEKVTPNIAIRLSDTSKEITIGLGGLASSSFVIDWGEGNLEKFEGAKNIRKTPKANLIKVYGDELMILKAVGQGLTEVTFGNNPKLAKIQIDGNQISSLNVSNLPALQGLYCSENKINGTIDLSACTNLTGIDFSRNQISGKIDLSKADRLSSVKLYNNQVTELILPASSLLQAIDCDSNQIATLSLGQIPELQELNCGYNQLKELLLANNTKLTKLYCPGNQLTTLDLKNNKLLTTVVASDNKLKSIDLSACSLITDLFLQNNNLNILDLNSNKELKWTNLSDNKLSGAVSFALQPQLQQLRIGGNQITSLDLQKNGAITVLFADRNQLKELDISLQKNLVWLACNDNQLSQINLSQNPNIAWLECHNNLLSALNIDAQKNLQKLFCYNNQLTFLNITGKRGLQSLLIQQNRIEADALNAIIEALPDVTAVEIHDNNKDWAKRLNIKDNPGTQQSKYESAKAKGWIVTTGLEISSIFTQTNPLSYIPETATLQCCFPMISVQIYQSNGTLIDLLPFGQIYDLQALRNGLYIIVAQATNGQQYSIKICK